jgi:hypothetical protein
MIIKDLSGDYSSTFGQWTFITEYNHKKLYGYIRWRYGNIEISISESENSLGKIIYCDCHKKFYDEGKYRDIINKELEKICNEIDLESKIDKCQKSGLKGSYKENINIIQDIDKIYPNIYKERVQSFISSIKFGQILGSFILNKKINLEEDIKISEQVDLFIKMSIFDEVKDII